MKNEYTLKQIKEIIENDKKSKCGKYYARKYYNYKPNTLFPDISLEYEKDIVDSNGEVRTITVDRQPFMYTNFAKLLVNQKVDYMLAKEATFQKVNNYTSVEISDMLEDMCLTASLDTKAWLFLYILENNLTWAIVPDSQIKPIYDNFGKNIIEVFRYYTVETVTTVEIWDLTGVRIVKYKSNNNYDTILEDEEKTHYKDEKIYNGQIESIVEKNLPFIPFIPMCNNKNLENDLDCIKDLLDFYNIIKSGMITNVLKFQEMMLKLHGFSGDEKFYNETMKNMQKFKMICLPDSETDANYMSIDIPVEARELLLTAIRENIFKIGQGFDPDKIGDGNITNIVIINRYSALDSKANKTIKQLKLFYEKFINNINLYYRSNVKTEIECNKSANWNESELIDNCVKSMDIIPDEYILENHPWVKDAKKALKLMEEQKQSNMDSFNDNIQNNENNTNNVE